MRRPDQTIPGVARAEILAEFMDALDEALDPVAAELAKHEAAKPWGKPLDFDLVPEC
jgi:hypothetical protein